jgi:polyferredoxin
MDRMHYPRGLVRYTTLNALDGVVQEADIRRRFLRPRVVIYTVLLLIVSAVVFASLLNRSPLTVNVIRDRGALAREVEGQFIENVYRLQITNKSHEAKRLVIEGSGLPELESYGKTRITVDPSANATAIIDLRIPISIAESLNKGSHKILLRVRSEDDPSLVINEKAAFFVPR